MESQSHSASDRMRTNWSTEMERYFVDLLLDQVNKGNRMGYTFNKQAWCEMLTVFNAKFGSLFDINVLKSRYTSLWTQYNEIKSLIEQSGFSWDDEELMVIASNAVWETYIQAHPSAELYRNKPLSNFNDLCLIYAHTTADGRYSLSSHDVDFDNDAQELTTVVDIAMDHLLTVTRDPPKIDWTLSMDCYFLKLMLEQLRKGNKSNCTFNRQAWSDMLNSFRKKFGAQYGKGFLRHRYKRLMNYYTDVKNLLEVKGFSWDENQQAIIADNFVWDNYIMANPNMQLYRRKTLLNYKELALIYGNHISNGHVHHAQKGRNFRAEILQVQTGENKASYSSGGSELPGGNWTLQMDCYFTDLLLDQALNGNKIGQDFTNQAWTEMVKLFSEKFGYYTQYALKSRSKYLRKRYYDINYLVNQHGFHWDEKQEMLIAPDDVWSSYCEVSPHSLSYRNRVVPSYHKLCVIYCQETSDRRCSPSACISGHNGPISIIEGDYVKDHDIDDLLREDWTPSMDRFLIDLMLEEVRRGNKIEYAFKNQTWMDMVLLFKNRFAVELDRDFLKGCSKDLETLYFSMKDLLDERGFWWDETQQMVTAHTQVWDAYLKEHPDAKLYRGKRVPNYNDLSLIYGVSDPHERINLGSQDMHCKGGGSTFNNSHGRIDWTPAMDRYFIDLMLEQVCNGSMIDHKFSNLAWRDMIAKFRANFGKKYDKYSLKSRFILLRKRFDGMKTLLDQSGFIWDEMQQKVTAHDDLWDAYVQEHPGARSYRGRTLPNFSDLFLIYGNSNFGTNQDCSTHVRVEKGNVRVAFDLEESDEECADSAPLRIPWSTGMDRYLIDLLLEQMRRGNKIGLTFTEKAWTRITASFNSKFQQLFQKDVFKERYFNLTEVYGNITDFLDRYGIAWEEVQYTVEAYNVLMSYFKEHPDDITYGETILHNFGSLCFLFGDQDEPRSSIDVGSDLETRTHYFGSASEGVYGHMQLPSRELGTSPASRKRKSEAQKETGKIQRISGKDAEPEFLKSVEVKMPIRKGEEKDGISIETVVAALQTIPNMDDEVFLEACKLLEDETNAKMFVAMDATARWRWLMKELDQ